MSSARSSSAYLPIEVIFLIIEQTDDLSTLDNWCLATAFSLKLHQVALRRRWSDITMTHDDFISKSEGSKQALQGSLVHRANRVYTFKNTPLHTVPACHIKSLWLWFHWNEPRIIFPEGNSKRLYEELPCCEDMQFSLATLLANCLSIEELRHDGVLHQENLDEIAKLTTAPLKVLRLRETRYQSFARWRHPPPGWPGIAREGTGAVGYEANTGNLYLSFEKVTQLKHLRCLEISQVWSREGKSLGQAVEKLEKLETLLLVAGPVRQRYRSPSVLLDFLLYIFPIASPTDTGRCLLPITLRSLVLSDPWERIFPLPTRPRHVARSSFPRLTNLYLDLDSERALEVILDYMDMPTLSRLYIPSVITKTLEDALSDVGASVMAKLINSAIRRHESSLEEIVLLNAIQHASRGEAHIFNGDNDWEATFMPQDLVFASRPPCQHFPQDPSPRKDFEEWLIWKPDPRDVMQKHCNLYRRIIECGQHHLTLKRLRIDQINFYEDKIDELFTNLEFCELKVLMLYPWAKTDNVSIPYQRLPTDLNSFVEGRMVLRIAAHNMPRLRVLVVGGFKFWFNRDSESSMATDTSLSPKLPNIQVYHFVTASENEHLRASLKNCISERDKAFMNEIPVHPMKQGSRSQRAAEEEHCNYLFVDEPSSQMFKHGNYTVLRKDDSPGKLSPPDPSIRRLTDRVTFEYKGR